MFPKSVCSLLFCKKKEKKKQRDPDFVKPDVVGWENERRLVRVAEQLEVERETRMLFLTQNRHKCFHL